MPKVFMGVGSNLGDRAGHFEFAQKELLLMGGLTDLRCSSVYETAPVDAAGGSFLNAVWSFDSELSPKDLLGKLRRIEVKAGRTRSGSHDARTLDLDILFYGNQLIREPGLTVPHPRLHERTFVLEPFCELVPDFFHPILKKTMKELLYSAQRRADSVWKIRFKGNFSMGFTLFPNRLENMKLIRDPQKLQRILQKERARGKTVGFVPTMGALHEGHLSLVRASRLENDVTVVSIFVNPTQFGPQEDLSKYPRPVRQDLNLCRAAKVDFVLAPSVGAIYPEGLAKPFKINGAKWPRLAKGLCGRFRPGHFQGVVTVVAKLLGILGPCRLYLGAKDYQQAAVICQMVKDLGLKVRVEICPTVREKDGLAMSSRNRYLSSGDRRRALAISQVLFSLLVRVCDKKSSLGVLKAQALKDLKLIVDRVQYLEIVNPVTLAPVHKRSGKMVALTACFVGKTRLIDNVIIRG